MCGYCVEQSFFSTIFSKPFQELTNKDIEQTDPSGKEAYLYPELIYTNEFGLPYLEVQDPSSPLLVWSLLHKSFHYQLSDDEKALYKDIWNSYQKNKQKSNALTEISLMFPSVFNLIQDGPLELFPYNYKVTGYQTAKSKLVEQVTLFLDRLIDTQSDESTIKAAQGLRYKTLQLHPAFYELTLEVFSLSCWLLKVAPNSPVFYKIMNGYPDCPYFYCSFMPLQRYVAWEIYQYIGREKFISKSEILAPICIAYIAQHERADKHFVEEVYSLLLDSYKSLPFEGTGDAIHVMELILGTSN